MSTCTIVRLLTNVLSILSRRERLMGGSSCMYATLALAGYHALSLKESACKVREDITSATNNPLGSRVVHTARFQ